ncbi:glycerophosphodiester phosphodiesterase [Heyndrickxia ginsengihumi]|uniref:Glycerophosphodiester phosphodiesterase n=1 Tax=Heyndrickxia ginsengihumi TaxID=363870 RepID=A0A0A6VFG8_9BACI|nr:glycerophosphodiester phosphodiesterase [Heyndrickxia ginsengihumi]KHD86311.1 glycerophosphodiester phosphodiesterase [Heyndrickxia ginsengihumi]MBE6185707.1 glycerophosphodiester phosphodiesterase [Bacillus sp. (in: firmicutes)]MCM3023184.1 glycerophosphodiester phosphodiesterase [Heyndrickxia ginsengihumi]NEY20004.1 glycerophosphodiester phosphodiesterase [Heyndrickxia ginsengihumi]
MSDTMIFGHRGCKGTHPENTLLGFYHACKIGIEGIELDVHMTKDHELVVIHDEKLDRTTNGTGYVKDLKLKDIKQYSAGMNFDFLPLYHSSWDNEQVPTLEEVLELVSDYPIMLNIELKTDVFHYPNIEEKTMSLVEKYNMEGRVVYSSFNLPTVQKIRELDSRAEVAFLSSRPILNIESFVRNYRLSALHLKKSFLLGRIAEKQYPVPVRIWTVNSIQQMKRVLRSNLAGIITDYPEIALQLRK